MTSSISLILATWRCVSFQRFGFCNKIVTDADDCDSWTELLSGSSLTAESMGKAAVVYESQSPCDSPNNRKTVDYDVIGVCEFKKEKQKYSWCSSSEGNILKMWLVDGFLNVQAIK